MSDLFIYLFKAVWMYDILGISYRLFGLCTELCCKVKFNELSLHL